MAIPVTLAKDHAALLHSPDPKLAANKKLCYDFYRVVARARHLDQAGDYMQETYIQHNPNAETGMKGFKDFFSKLGGPITPPDEMPDVVWVMAEGDMVTIALRREYDDPANPGQKYSTTWFDMFRVEDGKVAEHWDCATKPVPAPK